MFKKLLYSFIVLLVLAQSCTVANKKCKKAAKNKKNLHLAPGFK